MLIFLSLTYMHVVVPTILLGALAERSQGRESPTSTTMAEEEEEEQSEGMETNTLWVSGRTRQGKKERGRGRGESFPIT